MSARRRATVADLAGLTAPADWHLSAACASTDPELFHLADGESPFGERTKAAKRVCASCPVRSECLAEAFRNDERLGVRGGLAAHERRQARRARTTPAATTPATTPATEEEAA